MDLREALSYAMLSHQIHERGLSLTLLGQGFSQEYLIGSGEITQSLRHVCFSMGPEISSQYLSQAAHYGLPL